MGSILRHTKIAKIPDFFHLFMRCDYCDFFMCIDAILGCDIFEKKTFDSILIAMRLPSLVFLSLVLTDTRSVSRSFFTCG